MCDVGQRDLIGNQHHHHHHRQKGICNVVMNDVVLPHNPPSPSLYNNISVTLGIPIEEI